MTMNGGLEDGLRSHLENALQVLKVTDPLKMPAAEVAMMLRSTTLRVEAALLAAHRITEALELGMDQGPVAAAHALQAARRLL